MIVVMMLPCTWVVCPTHQHPPVSQPAPFSVGEHNQIYLTLSFNVTLWKVRIHHISASLMLRNQWLLICFIVLYPCVWTAYPFQPNQPAGVPCINGWGLGCPQCLPPAPASGSGMRIDARVEFQCFYGNGAWLGRILNQFSILLGGRLNGGQVSKQMSAVGLHRVV